MVRNEKTRTAALVLTVIIIAIRIFGCDVAALDVAICEDASVPARLLYSFFHASLVHALVNCWCLLSIVFIYDVSLNYLIIAYIIAATYPVDTIGFFTLHSSLFTPTAPTVGLSAMCFALLGMVFFQVRRKLYFTAWLLSFIAVGYTLPTLCSLIGISVASPNNIIHIYSYMAGLFVGFLYSPAPWIRK